jgi:hypothetical protein
LEQAFGNRRFDWVDVVFFSSATKNPDWQKLVAAVQPNFSEFAKSYARRIVSRARDAKKVTGLPYQLVYVCGPECQRALDVGLAALYDGVVGDDSIAAFLRVYTVEGLTLVATSGPHPTSGKMARGHKPAVAAVARHLAYQCAVRDLVAVINYPLSVHLLLSSDAILLHLLTVCYAVVENR